MSLTINERIRRLNNSENEELDSFSNFLLKIGNGTFQTHPELGEFMIRIPDEYLFQSSNLEDFIDWCFPDINNLSDRAILTPLNEDADKLNQLVLDKIDSLT